MSSRDSSETPHIVVVTSELFEENAYIVWRPPAKCCAVVDPGLEPDRIIAELEEWSLTPEAILNTHGHADHIAGNGALKARWPDCPIVIGSGDAYKLSDPQANLSAQYGVPFRSPPADRLVDHGDVLELAGVRWTVRDAPGHSAGHVVFAALELAPVLVLGGDVLFAGSVGRTDFPDGNFDDLVQSIERQFFTLPDDSVVLPGHGPATTVGREKQYNPFVGERALRGR